MAFRVPVSSPDAGLLASGGTTLIGMLCTEKWLSERAMKLRELGASRPVLLSLSVAFVLGIATTLAYSVGSYLAPSSQKEVMLILRGIAGQGKPRGQLDDGAALEYAKRMGYRGEVLDVAGNTGPDSPQVISAIERIRRDRTVTAIYGFSGGGYNARKIWNRLDDTERSRIKKVVILGAPGLSENDFEGAKDVTIRKDPPSGHLAGPKVLLEELDRS